MLLKYLKRFYFLPLAAALCCPLIAGCFGNGSAVPVSLPATDGAAEKQTVCSEEYQNKNGTSAIGNCLLSSLKIYSTFVTSTTKPSFLGSGTKSYALGCAQGSAVIYKIDGNDTYLLTNYHVVYAGAADEAANGGKFAKDIYCYLYGSEGAPVVSGEKDETYGYPLLDFGEYAVKCEYAGGSVTADLALLKVKTEDLKAVNGDIREITLADGYSVGETAVAIGNTEGEGISVTRGIVSVENEYITLNIDGTSRYYRSLRIDTSIYSGNSGGGLFNRNGELIGITNAGNSADQNINYAIPLPIVKSTAENLLCYCLDGNEDTFGAYKITLGVTASGKNSKYDAETEKITEDVTIVSVAENSTAEKLGLAEGDIVQSILINAAEYAVSRSFDISDILYNVRSGDLLSVTYLRCGERQSSEEYTVGAEDIAPVA